MLESAAAVALSLWLVATVAANLAPLSHRLRYRTVEWMIPEWRLFAPNPGTRDYFVWCESVAPDNSVSSRIDFGKPALNRARTILINVPGRQRNVRRNTVDSLFYRLWFDGDQDSLSQSRAYVALKLAAESQISQTNPAATLIQFGVDVQEAGTNVRQTAFASGFVKFSGR